MQLSLKEDVSKNLGSFRGSGNFLLLVIGKVGPQDTRPQAALTHSDRQGSIRTKLVPVIKIALHCIAMTTIFTQKDKFFSNLTILIES